MDLNTVVGFVFILLVIACTGISAIFLLIILSNLKLILSNLKPEKDLVILLLFIFLFIGFVGLTILLWGIMLKGMGVLV